MMLLLSQLDIVAKHDMPPCYYIALLVAMGTYSVVAGGPYVCSRKIACSTLLVTVVGPGALDTWAPPSDFSQRPRSLSFHSYYHFIYLPES